MVKRKQILIMCLFLTAATFIAFWRITHCEFTGYDDPDYVTGNSHVQDGMTMKGIGWAFTTGHASNWHPLTWISHMLDVQLFGLNPHWHHLVNLLFHIAATLLLFLVLHRMTNAFWQSAFVAALFALHPLHVESVAWVAERKDVLSAFFWMLTLWAYISYVRRPNTPRRLAVLLCFVLGLMAKPMLVTLPFVLLLLDYWPLKRFMQSAPTDKGKRTSKHTATERPGTYRWALIRPLLLEKIPLFVLAALSSVVTYIVQQQGGAVRSIEAFPLTVRLGNAFVSYIMYMGKMLWPMKLAVLYPHPGSRPVWEVLGAVLLLTAITSMVLWRAQRFPYLAVGWLWYLGTLVPVIGIVQAGVQAIADRYTYIPLIGLFIITAWGMPELVKKWGYRKEALGASSTLALACLFVATWTQVGYWQTSITLYDHTLEVTDHNSLINYMRGNYRQAIEDYDRVIEINPRYAEAYNSRGVAYNNLGNYRQAIEDFDRAIAINPRYAEAHNNRGTAYYKLGDHTRAIEDFDRAIEINQRHSGAYNNRGTAYNGLGNYRRAIEDLDKALEIDPKFAEAYNSRGVAYNNLGNYRQAIEDFDRAIEIDPKFAAACYDRGIVYYKLGDHTRAIEDLRTAARLGYQDARNFLKSQGIYW